MWKAYFANVRRLLGRQCNLQLLDRAVMPVFDYRNTRWPPHAQLELEIDRLQRKMIAGIIRPRMQVDETPADFVRRRRRIGGVAARKAGLWSARHCTRVLDWRDHLDRPRNEASWAAILLHYRGFQWLMEQRLQHGGSVLRGRTGTRVASGNVANGWHDGVRDDESVSDCEKMTLCVIVHRTCRLPWAESAPIIIIKR